MRRLLGLALIAGCAPSGPDTGARAAAIVGGSDDLGDPAVARLELVGGACTGALIAPTVILTAAHCAAPAVGAAAPGTASFGPGGATGFTESIPITTVWIARDWPRADADVALVRLAHAAAAAPVRWQLTALPAMTGATVRVVGFGETAGGALATAGTKRTVALTVRTDGAMLVTGDATHNTCQGDSGGPVFADLGDGEIVVAVVANGDPGCAGDARFARLDRQRLVDVALAAWDGPCAADGACASGCATIDPDCDACGFGGVCASACPAIDLDCPLGAGPGDDCAAAPACESRVCVTAPDDATVHLCSAPCDPANAGADCPAPLGACVLGACVYAGATPGVLGAACEAPGDCRGGLCDTRQHVCAVPCGPDATCPDGFACGPVENGQACTLPEGSCQAGGATSWPLALALLALARRRRR
ncbi:MAG: trypsin-like serine protease [Deltaproteobacteria bacterium]|nr:trypsin-like serine protease [Deltaproteobacteria bacterium]